MTMWPAKNLTLTLFKSVVLFIIALPITRNNVIDNYAWLLVLNGYLASQTSNEIIHNLELAWNIHASDSWESSNTDNASADLLLQSVDDYYIQGASPLYIITQTSAIPFTIFRLGGDSISNETAVSNWNSKEIITLYGSGYIEARLFFLTGVKSWRVSIRALNDYPPPVTINVWIDEQCIGELSYSEGDKSWEQLSLNFEVSPGFHWLRIWYMNDYLDKDLGIDRNAYIKQVVLEMQ